MIDYLARPLPLTDHQYAIIDRKRVLQAPDNWPLIELVSPMLAPQAHLYPWLVPLDELPSGEWRKLMADIAQHSGPASPARCSLLLSSTLSPPEIRSALVDALYVKDAHQKGHILRYYDPRVLFHLQWMLNPWQLSGQLHLQHIPCWTFWLEGEWHTMTLSAAIPYQPTATRELPLEQLQRCGLINQALENLPRCTDRRQRQERSRRIDTLLEQALKCGLLTPEDRVAFALHGLTQPTEFWAAPKMAAFLTQASQAPDLYRDETPLWDEQRWQDMTRPRNT